MKLLQSICLLFYLAFHPYVSLESKILVGKVENNFPEHRDEKQGRKVGKYLSLAALEKRNILLGIVLFITQTRRMLRYAPRFHKKIQKKFPPKNFQNKIFHKKNFKKISNFFFGKILKTGLPKL
jgi:hypothetical protein